MDWAGMLVLGTRVTRQIHFSKYIFFGIYLPVIRVFAKRALVAFASAPVGTTMFDMEEPHQRPSIGARDGDGRGYGKKPNRGKPISVETVTGR